MEVLFFFAESDGHGEEVLKLADEVMEQHDNLQQHLAVLEYSYLFVLFTLVRAHTELKFLAVNGANFTHQIGKVIKQQLFDLVSFDALVLHLFAFFPQSVVNVDYEVREAFNFDVVFILKTLDHLVHLDPVLLQVVLLDLFQSDFGGLLCLDLLKLFLLLHEELNQFL